MAIVANDVRWTLSDIRTKVRKLTGRPSANQISNDDLDIYINRFYTQDLVEQLNLKSARGSTCIDLLPGIQVYSLSADVFVLDGPVYFNGHALEFVTDVAEARLRYPELYQNSELIDSGDGSTTNFTGSLAKTPIDAENIHISDGFETYNVQSRPQITDITQAAGAVVTTEAAHNLITGDQVKIVGMDAGMTEVNDVTTTITKQSDTTFVLDGVDSSAYSDYLTGGEVISVEIAVLKSDIGGSGRVTLASGAYDITFNTAPSNGTAIRANYQYYNQGEPNLVAYFNDELEVFPAPDKPYQIELHGSLYPKAIVNDQDGLIRNSLGKLIAYGASIDLLNDEGEQPMAQILEPQFRKYMNQAMHRVYREDRTRRAAPRF